MVVAWVLLMGLGDIGTYGEIGRLGLVAMGAIRRLVVGMLMCDFMVETMVGMCGLGC